MYDYASWYELSFAIGNENQFSIDTNITFGKDFGNGHFFWIFPYIIYPNTLNISYALGKG